MSNAPLIARAAAPWADVIRDLKPDQLGAPTPCAAYDVRALVNHLFYWGPSLDGAGRKEFTPPPATPEAETDFVGDDWATDLTAYLDRLVAAWSEPAAWLGTTRMGSATEWPAATIGGMVLVELVVHGWDLARAIGQRPEWDSDVTAATYQEITGMAAQGREMGVFGTEITVPATASTVDRLLAVSGRDPKWAC
jgi:uncharacterized protein (TIGR03086 family)